MKLFIKLKERYDLHTYSIGKYLVLLIIFFIISNSLNAQPAGPRDPAAATTSGAGVAWANPGNCYTQNDVASTTANITSGGTSQILSATTFGFAIPDGSTIDGIVVEIDKYANAASTMTDNLIQIIKGGTPSGDNKFAGGWWPNGDADAYVSYGGVTDKWGLTWTAADINATNFGVAIQAANNITTNKKASVDHVRITVYYTPPPPNVITKTGGVFATNSCDYIVLSPDIVVTEGSASNFDIQTGYYILDAPAGFEFNTSASHSVARTAGTDISVVNLTVTAAACSVQVTTTAQATIDAFTISGLELAASTAGAGAYTLDYNGTDSDAGWSAVDGDNHGDFTVNAAVTTTGGAGAFTYSDPSWIPVSNLVIDENVAPNFINGQTAVKLVIAPPAGFALNTGVPPTVTITGGSDVTYNSVAFNGSNLEIDLNTVGVATIDQITISGLEVRWVDAFAGTYNLTYSCTGSGKWGIMDGATFGNLTVTGGPFVSEQDGTWATGTTWVGGSAPGAADDAIVRHQVTMGADVTIADLTIDAVGTLLGNNKNLTSSGLVTVSGSASNIKQLALTNVTVSDGGQVYTINNPSSVAGDLTIEAGGIFDCTGNSMTLSGNVDVDGTFYTLLDLTHDGAGKSFSGTGTINLNGNKKIKLFGNNCQIDVGSDLYIYGGTEIQNGLTFTNYGTVEITEKADGKNATSHWINEANSFLRAHDKIMDACLLTASAVGNTVEYAKQGANDITTPVGSTYYHLTIEGSGTKTQLADLTILGNFSINSGIYTCAGFNIILKGDWTNTGAFTESTGTVTINGTTAQSLTNASDETFYNLSIDKSTSTLTLYGNVYVQDIADGVSTTLTLTSGYVSTGTYKVSLGSSTNRQGILSYVDGWIVGRFERYIASTAQQYLFPIGVTDYYRPISPTFSAFTGGGGAVTAKFTESSPGALNPRPTDDNFTDVYNPFVDGYWTLTKASGFATCSYNLEAIGNGFSAFSIVSTTRLFTRVGTGNDWLAQGTHVNAVGSTAYRTGLSTFSADYCFCDVTPCSPPPDITITGDDSNPCVNDIGVKYSVPFTSGSTYDWSITPTTAGTITLQQDDVGSSGKSEIFVTWGATGQQSITISCTETNVCTEGSPANYSVVTHPVAPGTITGLSAVPEFEGDVGYSVTNLGYSYLYNWTITGGSEDPASSANSVNVDWGATGAGQVDVYSIDNANYCASVTNSATVSLPVIVYQIIQSTGVTTGWETTTTWDCNCIPTQTDRVRILGGHTVTLPANETILDLYINTGGTLSAGTKILTVNGNIKVSGSYTATNKDLELLGVGSSIDGVGGSINLGGGKLIIQGGNKNILSTASLTVTADVTYNTNDIGILNNGSITINGALVETNTTNYWTNKTGSTLIISGDILTTAILTASASGNTVHYNTAVARDIKTPVASTYYNLEFTGASTKTMQAALIVTNNVTINSGTFSVSGTNYALSVGGNWNNAGTFDEQAGTVTFNGSGAQSITCSTGETFYGMTVNKSAETLTLVDNVNVTNTLTMTAGNVLVSDPMIFTLGMTGPVIQGTLLPSPYTGGTIIGYFQRYVTTTASPILWPVGTASNYNGATVNFTNLTSGGLTINMSAGDPGGSGLPISEDGLDVLAANQFTEGKWIFTSDGTFISNDYSLILNGTGFTSFTVNSSTRVMRRIPAGSWAFDGTHSNAAPPLCYRNNLNDGFGISSTYEFGLGNSNCPSFTSNSITGSQNVCASDPDVGYSIVPNDVLNTFLWEITGGSLDDLTPTDENTNVDWGGTPSTTAKVQVTESSACYTATPVTLSVLIHNIPTSAITGPTSVPENTTQGPYAITSRTGYSYTWAVTAGNGAPVTGTGTSDNVNWGANSPATLTCTGNYSGCPASPDAENLAVTVYALIQSDQTGSYNTNTAWNPDFAPASFPVSTDNIQITAGNPITLTADQSCASLVIDIGAILDNAGFNLTVYGDYIVNGEHRANGGNITLLGTADGNSVGGSGTVTDCGIFTFDTYDKTILNTASLSITATTRVLVGNSVVITNNGSISITGNLEAGNATTNWINDASTSILSVSGTLFVGTGILTAAATGNRVTYSGAGIQAIKKPNNSQYYDLYLSGTSDKDMGAALEILGSLNITGTAVLDANNYQISLSGDWYSESSFSYGTGKVKLVDGNNQTITNTSGEITFYTFELNKQNGTITLGGSTNLNILSLFTCYKGIISAGTNLVRFPDGSTTNGGDADSFVDGVVRKTGNDIFTFPIGAGSTWARLGISAPSLITTYYEAQYFRSAAPNSSNLESSINNVSSIEYWSLNQSADDDVNVTFFWESATNSGIDDYSVAGDLTIGHWCASCDGGSGWWEMLEGTSSNSDPGWITVSPTAYSPFSFASKSAGKNPLPVELLYFTAVSEDETVNVSWATASEKNNDYFTVEKIKEGKDFEQVDVLPGAGNSATVLYYGLQDKDPYTGISYYRLKQTDFDGQSSVSDLVAVDFGDSKELAYAIYPNPSKGGFVYFEALGFPNDKEISLSFMDLFGREIMKHTFMLNGSWEYINHNLKSGIYLVRVECDGQKFQVAKIIVKEN